MNSLARYIDLIVEPTFDDFRTNPNSIRHAFLACVVAYHAIDRAAREIRVSRDDLRNQWREKAEFLIVDMVAHHFKHVESDIEKAPTLARHIPLPSVVFGVTGPGTVNAGGEQMELRNLFFLVRDAIRFLRQQAKAMEQVRA